MGTEKLLNAFKMELGHTSSGMSTDTLNTKTEHIRKLLTILEGHASIENGINRNESLSQAGKMAAVAKLGTSETAPSLKWLPGEIEKLEAKDQRYRTQFFTVDSGLKDSSERLPIFVYLWGKYDVLETGARIKRFAEAAERDQVQVMAAMLEHPEGPMLSEEFQKLALIERAKRLTPNDVTNFEQGQILLEFLTMTRDWLGRWLKLEVGVELAVLRKALGDEVADALK